MEMKRVRDTFRVGLLISSICVVAACTTEVRQFDNDAGATGGSGGAGGGGQTGGGGGSPPCVPETDGELCFAQGYDCGSLEAVDKCGVSRAVDCAPCILPERCGGAGEANHCGLHPPLTGVDGYILQNGSMGGSYKITFATDGVASSGGFCCGATIDEARQSYPSMNLLWLPPPVNVVAGEIPALKGVDGYIVPSITPPGSLGIRFAIDGALTGDGDCCFSSIAEAQAKYPQSNLGYLPYFPM